MFTALSRPYKERPAKETIDKIRNILEPLGLLPEITLNANPFPEIYSVSLALPSNKGAFRANGKGRTKEYCLASAYAEFIERLQNGLHATYSRTLQTQLYQEFGFHYDPRERFLTQDEFNRLPEVITNDLIRYSGQSRDEFIRAYYECVDSNKMRGLVSVPFYCSKTQKEEFLPLNLLLMMVSSNGMAAGNTYEEALYQALCEIMERWASARVYYNRLTPPTVPDTYLCQFTQEQKIISEIQKSGKYRAIIKDFSIGIGIPSVGVIIHNTQKDTYRLNIGCDTSFQVALSRCLTEIFQGFKNEEGFDECLLAIPLEDPSYFSCDDERSLDLRSQAFANFSHNGSGSFPPSLFGANPSYQFDSSAFNPQGSHKEEIDGLIKFFHSLGLAIYVRDVSYLGFPSVLAYVPGVSTVGKVDIPLTQSVSTYDLIEADKLESEILQINYKSDEVCNSLASRLCPLPAYALLIDLVSIKLDEDSAGSWINVSFLLSQLWFRLGKLDDAADAFLVFQAANSDKSDYYQAMGKYIDFLVSGQTNAEARKNIEAELGQTAAVQQACYDLENHEEYFNRLPLPKCPNCSACPLEANCITKRLVEISRTLYPVMKEALCAQTEKAQ